MKKVSVFAIALSALAVSAALFAQGQAPAGGGMRQAAPPAAPKAAGDTSNAVAGGGVFAPGWTGKIDAAEAGRGLKLEDAKLSMQGGVMTVTTGPAVTYWNPANKAAGDYTVKATFTEPKFQNLMTHPHPYGIMIAGNDMGGATQSFLYCAAYGTGTFIVRGFGPDPFQMNGRQGAAAPSVNKAAAIGSPVTQEVAMSVKGSDVSCTINGAVVATYTKADLATRGIKSTDGVYGIRFAHNTEGTVSGLAMTK